MEESPIEYKVALAGNTVVGKTSLFDKLTTGEFFEKKIAAIQMDKKSLSIEIEVNQNDKMINKEIKISLIDTPGKERFRILQKNI